MNSKNAPPNKEKSQKRSEMNRKKEISNGSCHGNWEYPRKHRITRKRPINAERLAGKNLAGLLYAWIVTQECNYCSARFNWTISVSWGRRGVFFLWESTSELFCEECVLQKNICHLSEMEKYFSCFQETFILLILIFIFETILSGISQLTVIFVLYKK